jgi:hypothetical protein
VLLAALPTVLAVAAVLRRCAQLALLLTLLVLLTLSLLGSLPTCSVTLPCGPCLALRLDCRRCRSVLLLVLLTLLVLPALLVLLALLLLLALLVLLTLLVLLHARFEILLRDRLTRLVAVILGPYRMLLTR